MTHPLGAGLGFKPAFANEALHATDAGLWFEVHPENYLVAGGPRMALLEALRATHPVSLHGVSMSLAGVQPLPAAHLQRLAALVDRLQPMLVSEHLAWSRFAGAYAPDLLPVPRTTRALQQVATHVQRVQEALRRPIAIENPAHYLHLDHDWSEVDFLHALVRRTGCALLVDLNNVFVSAHNLGFDAAAWTDAIDGAAVVEIHVAGHRADGDATSGLLIDSHDAPVAPPVWALLARLVQRIGPRPTLLERDGEVPPWATLVAERDQAQQLLATPSQRRAA